MSKNAKGYLALSPNPKDLVNVFAFADLDHVSFHIKHDTSKDLYLAFLEAHQQDSLHIIKDCAC